MQICNSTLNAFSSAMIKVFKNEILKHLFNTASKTFTFQTKFRTRIIILTYFKRFVKLSMRTRFKERKINWWMASVFVCTQLLTSHQRWSINNKTKYFRLRLSDKNWTLERAERVLMRKHWPLNADSNKSETAGVDWARLKDASRK